MSASTGGATGGTDKTILFVGLLLGGFLLWKFVIKPEMDKKDTIIYESDNDGNE